MLTPKKGTAKPKSGSTAKKTTVKKGYAPNQTVSNHVTSKDGSVLKNRYITTNASGKKDYINTSNTKYTGSTAKGKEKSYYAYGKPTYTTANSSINSKGNYTNIDNFRKSMDTTGYAAGKKDFTINSITKTPGKLTTTKSVKIKRDQVTPELQKWKKAASKMHKKGGVVRSKK